MFKFRLNSVNQIKLIKPEFFKIKNLGNIIILNKHFKSQNKTYNQIKFIKPKLFA